MLISLRDLLNENESDIDSILSMLCTFTCEKDRDIESFLHNKAIEFEKVDKGRTYLICDDNALINQNKLIIQGYFTISLKDLILPENFSIRARKELDGYRGKIHGKPIREVPCYLIGQLARNDSCSTTDLSGDSIMGEAIAVIDMVYNAVGGRYVMVECRDNEKLKSYYSKNDFKEFLKMPNEEQPMVQMLRRLG